MHGMIIYIYIYIYIYVYNKGTFLLSPYFLATKSDRCMRLLTRVYGMTSTWCSAGIASCRDVRTYIGMLGDEETAIHDQYIHMYVCTPESSILNYGSTGLRVTVYSMYVQNIRTYICMYIRTFLQKFTHTCMYICTYVHTHMHGGII